MPNFIRCRCGASFSAADHLAGMTVACPHCGGALAIPPLSTPLYPPTAAPQSGWLPAQDRPPVAATRSIDSSWRAKWDQRQRWELSPILNLGVSLFSVLFVLSGPLAGFAGLSMIIEARKSADWPQADGVITRSEVREVGIPISPDFKPDIAYEYNLDGQRLMGNRVRTSDGEYDQPSGAERVVRRYPVGKQVRVYYDPANPQRSLLEAGAGLDEYVLIVVAMMLFGVGVAGFVFLYAFTK